MAAMNINLMKTKLMYNYYIAMVAWNKGILVKFFTFQDFNILYHMTFYSLHNDTH